MFFWTLNGPRIARRVALVLLLAVVGFGFTALGPERIMATLSGTGDDKPLTRANSPDDRVALTFDVTWGQEELTKIITVLDAQGTKATFFVGGTFLNLNPTMVKQIAAKGHEIGTLGQRIQDLSQLEETEVTSNLLASQSILSKTLGGPVRYFRPPQGDATPSVIRAARTANLITVTHSVDAEDYLERKAPDITKRVLGKVTKGDIIRLSASDWSKETAKALPGIIQGLKAKGFKIVLLSELVPQQ